MGSLLRRFKMQTSNQPCPVPGAHEASATSMPWVVVTNAGQDDQTIVSQAPSMGLAFQLKAELHDPSADVMKRLPNGKLTTEF
jgi:hypothetical protein